MKATELNSVPGTLLHTEEVVDTLLQYLADDAVDDLEAIDVYNGPSTVEESLRERLKALNSSNSSEHAIQEQIKNIQSLLQTAAHIRRDLALAISHKAEDEHLTPLRAYRLEDETFPEEIYVDKLASDSAYRWALEVFGLDIKEWATLGVITGANEMTVSSSKTSTNNTQQNEPTEIETAQLVLADLIRQFMVLACTDWAPGQKPEQRPTSKYLRAGKLAARPIAEAIVKEAARSTASDDSEVPRSNIGDVRALVEGQGTARVRTVKALRGYYRTIQWFAVALDARLRSMGEIEVNKTDKTHRVFGSMAVLLAAERAHTLVDDVTLRDCLERAAEKRLPDL